jgi:hypothetical protein
MKKKKNKSKLYFALGSVAVLTIIVGYALLAQKRVDVELLESHAAAPANIAKLVYHSRDGYTFGKLGKLIDESDTTNYINWTPSKSPFDIYAINYAGTDGCADVTADATPSNMPDISKIAGFNKTYGKQIWPKLFFDRMLCNLSRDDGDPSYAIYKADEIQTKKKYTNYNKFLGTLTSAIETASRIAITGNLDSYGIVVDPEEYHAYYKDHDVSGKNPYVAEDAYRVNRIADSYNKNIGSTVLTVDKVISKLKDDGAEMADIIYNNFPKEKKFTILTKFTYLSAIIEGTKYRPSISYIIEGMLNRLAQRDIQI